jgi:hypothetical protein
MREERKEASMEHPFVAENARERTRLRVLVSRLNDHDFAVKVGGGWTVAATLAHMAFWDQLALVRTLRWKESGVSSSALDLDLINDALLPLFLAIPPRSAANLAIAAAEAIDRELQQLSPEMVADIQVSGGRFRLFRSEHRQKHLDQVEAALKSRQS